MDVNRWRSFLADSKEEGRSLLREITDDELGHIQTALDEMSPEDLAFSKLFNGKMRVVIEFPTLDTESELGRFVDFFREEDYDVDWAKGLIIGEKELKPATSDVLLRQLTGEPPVPGKKRKIQMKIGKFFKKIAELTTKRDVYFQKIKKFSENNEEYGRTPERPGQVTGTLQNAALSEKELENYNRLGAHLEMYLPQIKWQSTPEWANRMGKYWQENAEYIKKEVKNLKNDQYSIILTRHPIDVLRMSDFDDITSCHSPPSRGSGESYYKCAVAEAHGHGAIAYVVHTSELFQTTGADDLAGVEADLQGEEIFFDEERTFESGQLEPVARLRLRKFVYENPDAEDVHSHSGRTQLAVPEQRVYGKKIPGFVDRVVQWARENQEEALQNMPVDVYGDGIDLNKFTLVGGSYEDTSGYAGRRKLIVQLTGRPNEDFDGQVEQDSETEDNLDVDLVGSILEQWQERIDNIADEWNNRYQAVEVEAQAEDDGGGGTYIQPSAGFQIKWDEDEFNSLPGYSDAGYAVSELNDIGWGWAEDGAASIRRVGDEIVMFFRINLEMVPDSNGMGFAADPDDFEDLCVALNAVDDYYDGVKEYVERYFKREGYLQGGAIGALAMKIIDDDISTAWELETDDRYDWDEVTQIDATMKFDFSLFEPELPEHNPQIALKIVNDRDFQILVRQAIHRSAQETLGTEYFVNTHHKAWTDASNDVIYEVNLRVNDYGNDMQVELLEHIITELFDEDETRDEILRPLVIQAMNSRMPSGMQKSFNENERIVKSWKSFLKG